MSIIAPLLAALLAVSFPFRGTIRYDGGGVIPGLTEQVIDFRLYKAVDDATALWGRRCTVNLQTNGMFVVEVKDEMGSEIPSGSGIPVTYTSLETALRTVGSDPLYAGFSLAGRDVELKPRTRIMPVPSALIAFDADQAASLFTLTNALAISENVDVAQEFTIKSELKAFQVDGTGTMSIGGNLSVSNAIIGTSGVKSEGTVSVNSKLVASAIVAVSVSSPTAAVTTVTAETASFKAAPSLSKAAPKGMIIMWYGDPKKIPQDWALCDGGTYGDVKTPNLQGRFIVGASKNPAIEKKTYNVGDNAGAASVKLEETNLPRHSHSFIDYRIGYDIYNNDDGEEFYTFEQKKKYDGYTTYVGGSEAHPNLPSYCAVYYLMKVK